MYRYIKNYSLHIAAIQKPQNSLIRWYYFSSRHLSVCAIVIIILYYAEAAVQPMLNR